MNVLPSEIFTYYDQLMTAIMIYSAFLLTLNIRLKIYKITKTFIILTSVILFFSFMRITVNLDLYMTIILHSLITIFVAVSIIYFQGSINRVLSLSTIFTILIIISSYCTLTYEYFLIINILMTLLILTIGTIIGLYSLYNLKIRNLIKDNR